MEVDLPSKESIRKSTQQDDQRGIDPSIAVQSLNIDPTFPSKAKKRHFGLEKDKIIKEEVRATYQRLVDRMFREQLGCNMEVCVDDMLVKSWQMDQHLANLAETFDTLRKYHMKFNPGKCAFEVRRINGYGERDRDQHTEDLSYLGNEASCYSRRGTEISRIGNPNHTDQALRDFDMMILVSHFSQLTTLPTNPLKLHRRPTSPVDETRLQYLVQVSIGPSMPNLKVLDLERFRPTLRSWFHSCQTNAQSNSTGLTFRSLGISL
ncbi:hypothetical protein Sango_1054300 [Sesamum angolense]|uniref:Reverse transcriptase domain-containing protein n=1 Tax=Sesamum angolense TaxID=2727404 RepID=A0AAE1X0Z9_9LAMI|nr:hypothetical protein Sango_1054300 [Sesamum angolense]